VAAVPFAALGWWGLVVARAGESLPTGPRRLLVGPLAALREQAVTEVRTPAGTRVRIHAPAEAGGRWLGLRDECPHLGCRLGWKAESAEYVCPCHAGRFDARGQPLAGPPAAAGLAMLACELEIERGLLFLRLTGADLGRAAAARAQGLPPHSAACLAPTRRSRRGRA
jgi:nitrite reductase/ring-hydroxylating ferredoxin subunit